MNIKEYIESGILETYVMGAASENEVKELLRYREEYPEIQNALQELEVDMELLAQRMAVAPPPGMWNRINHGINELATQPKALRLAADADEQNYKHDTEKREKYIEVESETTHIRVHKTWKWVFIAVFILSKIFLIASVYYYLENRQAQKQILDLKSQLKQYQVK